MRHFLQVTVFSLAPAIAHAADEGATANAATGVGILNVLGTLGVVLALVVIVSLGWLLYRFLVRRNERAKNDPRRLLRELCQVHGLSRRAERVLCKAAAVVGTSHPGRFFLEPPLLEKASKCEELKAHQRALGLLYERLFTEDL